ncbi:kinase-like domain-containing protein [Xylaria grammica]|nr:kinase-like domain-containing protein [Xylaria grammica]
MSPSLDISVIRQSYSDNILRGPYDEATRDIQCSLRFLVRADGSKWHIKITFRGTLPSRDVKPSELHRKRDFDKLCRSLDIGSLSLINDTVTEIVLSNTVPDSCHAAPSYATDTLMPPDAANKLKDEPCNMYACVVHQMQIVDLREDPTRMRFLPCDHDRIPTRDLTSIREERGLGAGVCVAYVDGDGDGDSDAEPYIYKTFNRVDYIPVDTEVLVHELENLATLQDAQNIVRLKAIVTSIDPYQTCESGQGTTVGQGLLLEYHANGTLRDALESSESRPWKQWALHIATGLDQMHQHGLTHMDIKPSNIVISAESKAILIDVSGRGFDHAWLSPEMQSLESPPSQPFPARVANDTWAFGKLALEMANASHDEAERSLLSNLHARCTAAAPSERASLGAVIRLLESPPPTQSRPSRTRRWYDILGRFSKKMSSSLRIGSSRPGPSR